jgi:hypothetical protein
MENELEVEKPQPKPEEKFDLGIWLGRRQAFDLMAGRCSAADVECLKTIRDRELFRANHMEWDEFCERHVGLGRRYVNRLIHHLEEFGPSYFHLSRMVRISAESYRQIAGAVSDAGIRHGTETIAIVPENCARIAAAVASLAQPAESKPAEAPRQKLERIRKRLGAMKDELTLLAGGELSVDDRVVLKEVTGEGFRSIAGIHYSLG